MNMTMPVAEQIGNENCTPRHILFVCTGNTCRSPMAEALLKHMLSPREVCSVGEPLVCPVAQVRSAGLYASEGAPITPLSAAALAEGGVVATPDNDYTAHKAQNVNGELVEWADEIVGLTASHAMELLMRYPEAASKIRTLPLDIPDPYGGDAEVYRACFVRLHYALELAYFTEGEK